MADYPICYSNSGQILQRSEMTLSAKSGPQPNLTRSTRRRRADGVRAQTEHFGYGIFGECWRDLELSHQWVGENSESHARVLSHYCG
jgi:hypothetical protein